jgi:hypothetical protein
MKKSLILLGLSLFITQCASLGGTYDKEKVGKIKKVAIVGFSYDAPLDTGDHMLSALSGKEDDVGPGLMGAGKMETAQKETPASKEVYDRLAASLKTVGWAAKPAADVKKAPSVKAFYNKAVKVGFFPLAKGESRYERDGLPQFIHVSSLAGKQEFAKMAKELGVDAIVVAYVHAKASTSIPMVTKLNHNADTMIQVFDPTTDAMIMNFSSRGEDIEGTTKTKIGKDFLAGVQKGTLAAVDKFGTDLQAKLKQ